METDDMAPEVDPGEDEAITGNRFVAVYPPFSCWKPEHTGNVQELLKRPGLVRPQDTLGLYIHLPFCSERCFYCYYLSRAGQSPENMAGYVEHVIEEATLYRSSPALGDAHVRFVYFGGGTPSSLPVPLVRRLIEGVKSQFPWSLVEEVTFECAPRSVSLDLLKLLKGHSVDRISLGIQQLDDRILMLNGRAHKVVDVQRAVDAIRKLKFDELNVDLIAGLVGETEESFLESLERVLALGPESVTIYQLEIPSNTGLFKSLTRGGPVAVLPTWAEKRQRLAAALSRLLGSGYELRSAYAAALKTGKHRRFVYQAELYGGSDLLGLGASSYSYLKGIHFQNLSHPGAYRDRIRAGGLALDRAYVLSPEEQAVREFILGLKMGRVDARGFESKFGDPPARRFAHSLEDFRDRGWVETRESGVNLTAEGRVNVDRMLPAFYEERHRDAPYW